MRTIVLAVVMLATACTPGQTAAPQSAPPAPPSAMPSSSPRTWPIKGRFPVAEGRALALDCSGSGKVTLLFEVGFDATGTSGDWNMHMLRKALEPRYRICSYDRANLGQSDRAPQPRTIQQISDDLAALLKTAVVPGPYLLVGISAGGLYIQDFAQRHPDNVVAALAMNPEQRFDQFRDEAYTQMNAAEKKQDLDYAKGGNSQKIDYYTSARPMADAGPIPVPFTVITSTDVQCDGDPFCIKTYPAYLRGIKKLQAQASPGGKYITVKARHDLYLDHPDLVINEIDRLAALA
jgi:hypothetical protein